MFGAYNPCLPFTAGQLSLATHFGLTGRVTAVSEITQTYRRSSETHIRKDSCSVATLPHHAGLPRLWDTAKSRIVLKEKVARVESFRLEGRAVSWDEPPMTNLATKQIDKPERWEFPADVSAVYFRRLGKDEPYAVVFRKFRAISQHRHDLVTHIDRKTRKHGSHFRLEGSERFKNEWVRSRFACRH